MYLLRNNMFSLHEKLSRCVSPFHCEERSIAVWLYILERR